MGPVLAIEEFHGVVKVTMAWFFLYYLFLAFQSFSKFYIYHMLRSNTIASKDKNAPSLHAIKYGDKGGKLGLTSDRTSGNMLEQSVPFLASLWLHAVFVDPAGAERLGYLWLLSRSFYPVVFHLGFPWFLLSTIPGYIFIVMMLYPLVKVIF